MSVPTYTLTLYLVAERLEAYRFSIEADGTKPFWVPASVVPYFRKHNSINFGENQFTKCTVQIEAWKARELGLEDEE